MSPRCLEFIERSLAALAVSIHENNILMARAIVITITPRYQVLPI